MKYVLKLAWTLFGFGFGVIASLVGVELVRYAFAELYGSYYRPMQSIPPGVLIGGIVTGWVGFKTAPTPERVGRTFANFSQPARYWIVATVCWVLLLLILVWGVDLLGSYWTDREWRKFWVILLGPPSLALVAIPLIRWARSKNGQQSER